MPHDRVMYLHSAVVTMLYLNETHGAHMTVIYEYDCRRSQATFLQMPNCAHQRPSDISKTLVNEVIFVRAANGLCCRQGFSVASQCLTPQSPQWWR